MKMFISAEHGFVKVYKGVNNVVGGAKTAKGLAWILATHKVNDYDVYFQSSMDFADEEGFDHHDDAKKIWDDAMELI
jgi:hypothetical protein